MNVADIRKITAQLPPRILFHGAEGVGKTTIASKFPAPIFLQTEDGCPSGLEINSFGLIDNLRICAPAMGALASEQHPFRPVVTDSLDATQELIWHDASRSQGWSSIESPGYGKGYVIVNSWWNDILKGFDFLRRERGMIVLLLAHCAIETINDPRAASYTSYQLRLHKRARGLVQDWGDVIGFLASDLHVQSEDADSAIRAIAPMADRNVGCTSRHDQASSPRTDTLCRRKCRYRRISVTGRSLRTCRRSRPRSSTVRTQTETGGGKLTMPTEFPEIFDPGTQEGNWSIRFRPTIMLHRPSRPASYSQNPVTDFTSRSRGGLPKANSRDASSGIGSP